MEISSLAPLIRPVNCTPISERGSGNDVHNSLNLQEQEVNSSALRRIFRSAHHSYRPFISHSLAIALKRYIDLKPEEQRKTDEFGKEVANYLYFIHEYNTQVLKFKQKYPRNRYFDQLLIRYVELEYDILYNNNSWNIFSSNERRKLERLAERRVKLILQTILKRVVTNSDGLTKELDIQVKKLVLQVLVDVKPQYLIEGRIIFNIARQLIAKINGDQMVGKFASLTKYVKENFSVATSDYGTDDSDADSNEVFALHQNSLNYHSDDANELSIRENGDELSSNSTNVLSQPAVVSIEFIHEGSGLDYMTFSGKHLPPSSSSSSSIKNDNHSLKRKNNGTNHILNVTSNKCKVNSSSNNSIVKNNALESSVVLLSSDSENETPNKNSNSKKKKRNEKHKQRKNPVVTFEILDDEDDDSNNYMVYLQAEIKTKKKQKKKNIINNKNTVETTISLCSDSEDANISKTRTVVEQEIVKIENNLPKYNENKCDQETSAGITQNFSNITIAETKREPFAAAKQNQVNASVNTVKKEVDPPLPTTINSSVENSLRRCEEEDAKFDLDVSTDMTGDSSRILPLANATEYNVIEMKQKPIENSDNLTKIQQRMDIIREIKTESIAVQEITPETFCNAEEYNVQNSLDIAVFPTTSVETKNELAIAPPPLEVTYQTTKSSNIETNCCDLKLETIQQNDDLPIKSNQITDQIDIVKEEIILQEIDNTNNSNNHNVQQQQQINQILCDTITSNSTIVSASVIESSLNVFNLDKDICEVPIKCENFIVTNNTMMKTLTMSMSNKLCDDVQFIQISSSLLTDGLLVSNAITPTTPTTVPTHTSGQTNVICDTAPLFNPDDFFNNRPKAFANGFGHFETVDPYLVFPESNVVNPSLVLGNTTNENNQSVDDSRLNDSFLEEVLDTSYLYKKDFKDLECFLFDNTEKHSFGHYCGNVEEYDDNDDINFSDLLPSEVTCDNNKRKINELNGSSSSNSSRIDYKSKRKCKEKDIINCDKPLDRRKKRKNPR